MIDAKAYLQQIKLYDTHINNKLEEKARLKMLALNITSTIKGDVSSGSHSQDKIGDAMAKIVDLDNEINLLIDKFIDYKEDVNQQLLKLKNPNHRKVLYKRYIDNMSWNKIAADMEYSYRGITKLHGKALLALEKVMKNSV